MLFRKNNLTSGKNYEKLINEKPLCGVYTYSKAAWTAFVTSTQNRYESKIHRNCSLGAHRHGVLLVRLWVLDGGGNLPHPARQRDHRMDQRQLRCGRVPHLRLLLWAAGVAIFSLAAITAACIVPHWHPAPWYRGSWHYPPRVRRMAVPPHVPGGHHPGVRPAGGMNAPIHRNPASVLHPTPSRPAHPSGPSHTPPRGTAPQHSGGHSSPSRPSGGNTHFTRPSTPPSHFNGPSSPSRPSSGNTHFTRPSTPPSHFSGHSSSSRPSSGNTHFTRPAGDSSSGSRPHSGSSRFTRPSRG